MEVYFLDSLESEIVQYLSKSHLEKVHKFLYLQLTGKNVLIACSSNVSTHAKLLNVAMLQIKNVTGIFGAGAMLNGRVVAWKSEGLQVSTPKEHQPPVLRALGAQ